MTKKISLLATLLLMIAIMVAWAAPVEAVSQHPQAVYQTPTPNADGRVIYVVQQNDTCISIYLKTGADINEIRQLNNLDENCSLTPGQELVLSIQERTTVEPTAMPTVDPNIPTPTPFNGMGQICVSLFFDTNGNAMPETGEPPVENGAFSLQDKEYKVNENGLTAQEPVCKDVPEGDYNISVAPPEGFNPTTAMNYAIGVKAGDKHIIPFGAQPSSVASTPDASGTGSGNTSQGDGGSVWLLLVGLLLILAGIGLGVYFIFISRKNRVL
ncbi:MAG: LysM peptidoglycan-binding domain-containing protein [Anaerolineae bacterium]|nr:LysM peptidoglycan-binding domain-containing protein [Anaerolineae bacterium]